MKPLLVLMGVTGSGKTTVGQLLATALGVPFVDADDLHSLANVQKMAAGIPLTDKDRWPWLTRVGEELQRAEPRGLVVACSALRRVYRDLLLAAAPRTQFVFLDGERAVLEPRIEGRRGHFMSTAMLDSQIATLEPLAQDEPGITVSIDQRAAQIVSDIRSKLAAL